MNKNHLWAIFAFFVLCNGFPFEGFAQVTVPGSPFSEKRETRRVPEIILPLVDVAALIAEDQRDDGKGIPFRFGFPHEVNHNLNQSGAWYDLKGGDRLWLISFTSEGAYSLNFLFDDFYLPEGARLFIYNEDRSSVLGAFTSINNNPDASFGTVPVEGQTLTLEYYEPANARGQGRIQINRVVHAYKDFYKEARDFGDSGGCNNNINCPEGAPWLVDKRAVAMIMLGGFRLCTGAMVNNTANDGTPYFLTANHCLDAQVPNWTFVFNYESPTCVNANGSLAQAVNGATLRANYTPSDFGLLELNSPPPAGYNVFLAGWDKRDIPGDSSVGIHHPAGDVMKISFDYGTTVSSAGLTPQPDTHWEVTNWDDGTTEGGSSGSPLFSKGHRIVGQLHGGGAACGNQLDDNYGKFSYSWATGATVASRLREWLDPLNTNQDTLDGIFLGFPDSLDAAATLVLSPSVMECDTLISPEIQIRNEGATTLTSLDIYYRLDGGPVNMLNWTGSLGYYQTASVTLPNQLLNQGNHDLMVYVANPNGGIDQNNQNDTLNYNFDAILGNLVTFNLITDDYGDETTWELRNPLGVVVDQGGPYADNTTYLFEFCLGFGCYEFEIFDSYGDGICCGWGNGSYSLTDIGGMIFAGGNFGNNEITQLCYAPPVPPVAAIQAIDPVLCQNQTVSFTNISQNGPTTSRWYFPGGNPATSTLNSLSVTYPSSGNHTASLVATNGAGTDSTAIPITVHPVATIGFININDETGPGAGDGSATANPVGGTPPYTYSWNTIPVQTSQTATNLVTGTYTCTVIDSNGCTAQNIVFVDQLVALNPVVENLRMEVYPNPTEDYFTLALAGNSNGGEVLLEVTSLLGQSIIKRKFDDFKSGEKRTIQLGGLDAGVYFVTATIGNQQIRRKLIVL